MTDTNRNLTQEQVRQRIEQHLASRHRKEKVFRGLGIASVAFGILAVLVLFTDIISKGSGAFVQSAIQLEVTYDPLVLGIDKVDEESLTWANFTGVIREALRERFPEVQSRSEKRELYSLVSSGAPFTLRKRLQSDPELLGKTQTVWLTADDDVDTFVKSLSDSKEGFRGRTSDQKAEWIQQLIDSGELKKRFNTTFFTQGDSREPEQAGIRAALLGSFFTLLVTLVLSFPIGVAAAIYLEEYAPKNKWTDLIEVNINNLAAVPSIVFGLLGLAIFINFFELPRSAPLVGGLVLTLMTLPTIIISSRAALKAVPPSIREAALGLGASRMQTIFHHVLPLAMPGMLTGAIIGMAQALGETAPLLMIGMVAFIVDVPTGITDPATVLPVQIFLWADSPERAFVERTSAAIMVLLSFLIAMNTAAVLLRKKLERRW
ncbi:phosphate ABC transporter permease PstA [Microbulbifer thermotolerans]|uniref:phosphate ABC transporter permease PstA n=1 Tax=Microbulbifer thermotolerans TaxID=252514 RepID=UPI0022487F5D|nr:phosphate ABC transporter permease PstA [Microbulbifer thermotolerans]MCX2778590.1 phosphate ABC transporter permease PstA [Microbulbifer thermotolerans]MCX2803901.1 phosphate ABC transporter permease PstA [Microbulbifer thermotolerans]MCX2830736.1 phosphate ABC transporter permease PstA [Microbulbifer thermotolerans]